MDGNAARVAEREPGDEQVQSLTILKYRGMSLACVPRSRDYGLAGASARHDKSGRLGDFVSRDLQRVAVGIAKINRVRNFMILEVEFDPAVFKFALRTEKIFPVRTKREMKHAKFAVT